MLTSSFLRAASLGLLAGIVLATGAAGRAAAATSPVRTVGYAVVAAGGGTSFAKHVASAERLGVGRCAVRFDTKVRGCAYAATLGGPGYASVAPPGEIGVDGLLSDPKGVFVQTRNSRG